VTNHLGQQHVLLTAVQNTRILEIIQHLDAHETTIRLQEQQILLLQTELNLLKRIAVRLSATTIVELAS